MGKEDRRKDKLRASFKAGATALAFLIIGYQTALLTGRAAALRIVANRDRPDTVYVTVPPPVNEADAVRDGRPALPEVQDRRSPGHSPAAERVYAARAQRKYESFRFDPNTVSVQDLVRLGFSERQAAAIDKYRTRGGRFHRREDFAKSFVVADSVYRRLENYIDIPLLDINKADSAAFDTLPGIGPYFASRMVAYREEIGGYTACEQLLEIYNFGKERYDALSDLICCSLP